MYNVSTRLFVVCGKELLPHEGITQGDPTAMTVYGIALTPLKYLPLCSPERDAKTVAFADDLTCVGDYLNFVVG